MRLMGLAQSEALREDLEQSLVRCLRVPDHYGVGLKQDVDGRNWGRVARLLRVCRQGRQQTDAQQG
jgi:hypothetical protein